MKLQLDIFFVVFILMIQVFNINAQNWPQTNKILPDEIEEYDHFGYAVATYGDIIAMSSPTAHKIYVYQKNNSSWHLIAKLSPSTGEIFNNFGYSISMSENIIAVGAPDLNGFNQGRVYIYEKTGTEWEDMTESSIIKGYHFNLSDAFGYSLDISENRIVVGAYFESSNSGAAYVFEKVSGSWERVARLTSSDTVNGKFGYSVSISGDYIVIGRPNGNHSTGVSGAAYIFEMPQNGWEDMTESLILKPNAVNDYIDFGNSVSISGNHIVIGAPDDTFTGNGIRSGTAYVYKNEGSDWIYQAKIAASDGNTSKDDFGFSVFIEDDVIMVGNPASSDPSDTKRSVYIFEKNGPDWVDMNETSKLTPSDQNEDSSFGVSINMFGNRFIIGSPYDNENGESSGSIYVYIKNHSPKIINPIPDQSIIENNEFRYTINENVFFDEDPEDELNYSVQQLNEIDLPGWLSFNNANGEFIGEPTDFDLGKYSIIVKATDKWGEFVNDTFNITVNDITGNIVEIINSSLNIFPNPTKDLIHIQLKNKILKRKPSIKLFNSSGQMLFNNIEYNDAIDLTYLPKGVYILKIYDLKNLIYTKKITKY